MQAVAREGPEEKSLKKLKKVLKKVLTKARQCDIITRSPRERSRKRSLKIEQQREKYKANTKVRSKLEQFKLRNTTQTKSKRATKARE